ncbi:MAG: hypothetical protein A2286_09560 [Gammaproteobacteria bacterium RIFOXYA12_FULL_61_12]|nr:MAG: hypothetical protein A2514_14410 [Gammaproteobacteria bacterium RIFOXYD12_FULL_61_37]OGT93675.1 MAG: hypothetical protein A2286_09560 [Gammaproteobacteria bacterium RIFOXYA12_FULL_61_12]
MFSCVARPIRQLGVQFLQSHQNIRDVYQRKSLVRPDVAPVRFATERDKLIGGQSSMTELVANSVSLFQIFAFTKFGAESIPGMAVPVLWHFF